VEVGEPVDPVVLVGTLDFKKFEATVQDLVIALELENATESGRIACIFACESHGKVIGAMKEYAPAVTDALIRKVQGKPIAVLILTLEQPSVLHLSEEPDARLQ
jgi:hypothetical protein